MIVIASFLFFLLAFVLIGVSSVFQSKKNNQDYLLAGHAIKPWLASLSAVATNNSGYMFVGMIGYTYVAGLEVIWAMIGWVLGDFLISFLVHKKVTSKTIETSELSYNGLLAAWNGTNFKILRLVGGLITLVFLSIYAAAQLQAGSKALHVLFDWTYSSGAIIGAVIVIAYCFAGGIRASIWTDAAQSFVMMFAMAIMCYLAVSSTGDFSMFASQLNAVSPTYMNIFPDDPKFGIIAFVLGWLCAGVGIIGQPHVMVRFMTIGDAKYMPRIRAYYYSWYTIFFAMSILCGLAAKIIIPAADQFDAELALPLLAQDLLPPVLVGLVLAGLFAATMSTADSLVLSCTAAITRDIAPNKFRGNYLLTKCATVVVTAFALVVALYGPDSVFTLVVIAWAALGSAFGPLLILYALKQRPSQSLAVAVMISGPVGMLSWRALGYNSEVYEILPGMLLGFIIYALGKVVEKALRKTA